MASARGRRLGDEGRRAQTQHGTDTQRGATVGHTSDPDGETERRARKTEWGRQRAEAQMQRDVTY